MGLAFWVRGGIDNYFLKGSVKPYLKKELNVYFDKSICYVKWNRSALKRIKSHFHPDYFIAILCLLKYMYPASQLLCSLHHNT